MSLIPIYLGYVMENERVSGGGLYRNRHFVGCGCVYMIERQFGGGAEGFENVNVVQWHAYIGK